MAAGKRCSYHGCTTATSATAHHKISAVSESQQPVKLIHLVKERATRKERAQHYEGKRLECSERAEWKEKGLNTEEEKEKNSIDRKSAFPLKVEGIYDGKEE